MANARSIFKSSVCKYRLVCRKRKTQHLLESKYKNAKEYWKLLEDLGLYRHRNLRTISERSMIQIRLFTKLTETLYSLMNVTLIRKYKLCFRNLMAKFRSKK